MKENEIKRERSCILVFIGAPFFLISLLVLFTNNLPSIYDAVRMHTWSSVEGKLFPGARNYNKKQKKKRLYYTYTVKNEIYKNDRVFITSASKDSQKKLARILQYMEGQWVLEAYNC